MYVCVYVCVCVCVCANYLLPNLSLSGHWLRQEQPQWNVAKGRKRICSLPRTLFLVFSPRSLPLACSLAPRSHLAHQMQQRTVRILLSLSPSHSHSLPYILFHPFSFSVFSQFLSFLLNVLHLSETM